MTIECFEAKLLGWWDKAMVVGVCDLWRMWVITSIWEPPRATSPATAAVPDFSRRR